MTYSIARTHCSSTAACHTHGNSDTTDISYNAQRYKRTRYHDAAIITNAMIHQQTNNEQPFFGPLIQDNPGEPMLSQRRDLLEQPLDFYELDVLPAAQPIVSKHYRKTQWFGRLLFYRHGISTPCLTNSVKALKEVYNNNV